MKIINPEPEFVDRKLGKKTNKIDSLSVSHSGQEQCHRKRPLVSKEGDEKHVQETKNYRMSCINPD